MPSVELSKLPGIGAPRALSASERAQVEPRPRPAAAAGGTGNSAATGISLEVTAAPEVLAPPVDAERVAEIRKALRDGTYPLVPTRIVDAMIAAQVSPTLPERS